MYQHLPFLRIPRVGRARLEEVETGPEKGKDPTPFLPSVEKKKKNKSKLTQQLLAGPRGRSCFASIIPTPLKSRTHPISDLVVRVLGPS